MTASGVPARRRWDIPHRRLLASIGILACALVAWLAYSASAGSSTDRATQAALGYARYNMVWTSGPSVLHVRQARVRDLPALLPGLLNATLRRDVNARDLVRRYGANRRVEAVVLSGVYNSLPPDEGVNLRGEVLAVVDLKTNRVLFLTD